MRPVRLATLVLAMLLTALAAGAATGPSTASATCGMQANGTFESWSPEQGSGIAPVFEGQVIRVRGPEGSPQYLVRVERLLAGARMPRFVRFSGDQICSSTTLDRGASYLFAVDPTRMDADDGMVFWRAGGEWVGGTWTFDGHDLPRDDRALLARFRASLPPLRSRLMGGPRPPTPMLPPPPPGFDRSAVRVVNLPNAYLGTDARPLWVSGVDGSAARLLAPLATVAAVNADGTVLTAVPGTDGGTRLAVFRPDGAILGSVPEPGVPMTFDPTGSGALVASAVGSFRVRLVRVDLADGSVTQFVAPTQEYPGPAFLSQDGRWLAWRVDGGDELGSLLRYRGPDGRVRSLGQGEPIGFDALGRLWHTAVDPRVHPRLAHTDPATGRTTLLRHLGWRDRILQLTPDGRFLVILHDEDRVGRLTLTDLVTGDRRTVHIPPGADPAAITDRHLVLRVWQGDTEGHVVVDLVDRWAGFVPWVDPAQVAHRMEALLGLRGP